MWIYDTWYESEKISLLINAQVILFPFQICNKKRLYALRYFNHELCPWFDLIKRIDDTGSDRRNSLRSHFASCRITRSIRSIKADNKEKGMQNAQRVQPCVMISLRCAARCSARRMPDAIRARRNEIISVTGGRIPRINNSQLSRIDVFSKIT